MSEESKKAPDYEEFDYLEHVKTEHLGTRRSYSIERWISGPDNNGTFWAVKVYVHPSEGVEMSFGFEPYPVLKKQVTTTEWVAAP